MGNNLDSVHMNGIMASRNIAALDVLPRSVADTSVVFDEPGAAHSRQNQIPQCINMTSLQQPKRIVLPRDGSQVPSSSLCLNSLRSRFAGNDSTTTGSSASGSRPPSPIIEVIPVAEYETKYGSLQHQNQHSTILYSTVPTLGVFYDVRTLVMMNFWILPPTRGRIRILPILK